MKKADEALIKRMTRTEGGMIKLAGCPILIDPITYGKDFYRIGSQYRYFQTEKSRRIAICGIIDDLLILAREADKLSKKMDHDLNIKEENTPKTEGCKMIDSEPEDFE